jgi:hypothetical protein
MPVTNRGSHGFLVQRLRHLGETDAATVAERDPQGIPVAAAVVLFLGDVEVRLGDMTGLLGEEAENRGDLLEEPPEGEVATVDPILKGMVPAVRHMMSGVLGMSGVHAPRAKGQYHPCWTKT